MWKVRLKFFSLRTTTPPLTTTPGVWQVHYVPAKYTQRERTTSDVFIWQSSLKKGCIGGRPLSLPPLYLAPSHPWSPLLPLGAFSPPSELSITHGLRTDVERPVGATTVRIKPTWLQNSNLIRYFTFVKICICHIVGDPLLLCLCFDAAQVEKKAVGFRPCMVSVQYHEYVKALNRFARCSDRWLSTLYDVINDVIIPTVLQELWFWMLASPKYVINDVTLCTLSSLCWCFVEQWILFRQWFWWDLHILMCYSGIKCQNNVWLTVNNGCLIILAIGLKGVWATTTREWIIVEQGLLTLPTGCNRRFSTDKGLLASFKHVTLTLYCFGIVS